MKLNFILVYLICTNILSVAQNITPSVINSGGKSSTVTINSQTVIYTDNIGEAIINTASNSSNILTQGFLQPDMVVIANTSISLIPTDVSCADKADGYIKVIIDNLPSGANVKYFWNPDTLCSTHDCSRINNLSAGDFTVKVVYSYTLGNVVKTDTITRNVPIKDENGTCKIKVYSGVDLSGINSTFTIDNIEDFPEASVKIFNRWGNLMFNTKNYNNKDNFWPKKDANIVPGTYFYIIEIGNGSKPIKGWVEVLN
jgi:gliding motility-associated-like protein